MQDQTTREYQFDRSAGELSLDFANTVTDRQAQAPSDHLTDYSDLISFGRQAGVITDDHARRLRREAGRRPAEAAAVLAEAVMLREAIFRLFVAHAQETAVAEADLNVLNAALGRAMAHARVLPEGGGFVWDWEEHHNALDVVLWPVARSAAELLTAPERLATVRECAADDCNWLFLDSSKNRSRRWCDMKSCGNRAKARRHYDRVRLIGQGPLAGTI